MTKRVRPEIATVFAIAARRPALNLWNIAIAAILAVAALVRFPRLDSVPLPLSDEVFAAVDVRSIVSTGNHLDGSPAGVLGYIVSALDGRFVAFFLHGATLVDLRVVSAVFGVATVALLIPLGIELGGFALGVLAAAVLAVMPWDIYFSRIFYPASEYAFLTTAVLVLTLRALRKSSFAAASGSAIAAVASIYIYPVAILATPLFVASILIVRRNQMKEFGLRKASLIAVIAGLLLLPYLAAHLFATDANVRGQNAVIANLMIWNHHLNVFAMASRLLVQWLSFLNPTFIIFSGDPNVRWSIQVMGSVGWVAGAIGWIGVILALGRRSANDRLLLWWLVLYPVADALTYYDASPNSVRGITGAVIWSLFVANGLLALRHVSGEWLRNRAVALVSAAMVVQVLAFTYVYFGSYTDQYAYAFETGYPKIYPVLRQHHLEAIPITLHAGYRRDEMVQYFSQYRLHASEQILACYYLPINVLRFTKLPRVFIIREDPDEQSNPFCIHKGLIQTDIKALLSVTPQPGEQKRQVDVIAIFYDDVSTKWNTAVLYVHY